MIRVLCATFPLTFFLLSVFSCSSSYVLVHYPCFIFHFFHLTPLVCPSQSIHLPTDTCIRIFALKWNRQHSRDMMEGAYNRLLLSSPVSLFIIFSTALYLIYHRIPLHDIPRLIHFPPACQTSKTLTELFYLSVPSHSIPALTLLAAFPNSPLLVTSPLFSLFLPPPLLSPTPHHHSIPSPLPFPLITSPSPPPSSPLHPLSPSHHMHIECDQWGPIRQPPPETIMFNMLIVLFVQGFANSASRHCVLLGWLISIVTTNVVISLIGSEAYFWINVEYLFLLCVSYEFERHTLRHFIKVHYTTRQYTSLYYTILHCIALLRTALHNAAHSYSMSMYGVL